MQKLHSAPSRILRDHPSFSTGDMQNPYVDMQTLHSMKHRPKPLVRTFLGIDLSAPLSSKEFMRRVREAEALSTRPVVREKAAVAPVECPPAKVIRSVVYFVQAASGGPVKIGVTTDLKSRVKGLQTGHPEPLRVLHWTVGDAKDEAYFHHRFADLRLTGEWFRHEGTLLAYLTAQSA